MIIKAYYTQDYFSHYDNDYNNTFTIPNTNRPITWREITNPRIKWIDTDRAELVINNYFTGTGVFNFRTISRVKIVKQYADTSSQQYGNYIYFVKEVKRQLDGGCIVELELDYWMTYFDLSPFGNVGSFLLGAPDQLIIDRSHLMPEPSSWLATTSTNHTYITNWPQYNALLSTLERVPFDISKSVDKIIYHNQNFLMCAPAYNDSCGIGSVLYPFDSNYKTIRFLFSMPFNTIATDLNTTHAYDFEIKLVYDGVPHDNLPTSSYGIPYTNISNAGQNLKNDFNGTTLFLVLPYNNGVSPISTDGSRVFYPDVKNSIYQRLNGFLLIPAPTHSAVYKDYVSGKFNNAAPFLIDMPLPNILGLINNKWMTAPSAIDNYSKIGVGIASFVDYIAGTDIHWKYYMGFTIDTPEIKLDANYLFDGVGQDTDTNDKYPMIDKRYNLRPKYCNWRDFYSGYTVNQNTPDLYLLKGLNNIYFNFKSGFIQ